MTSSRPSVMGTCTSTSWIAARDFSTARGVKPGAATLSFILLPVHAAGQDVELILPGQELHPHAVVNLFPRTIHQVLLELAQQAPRRAHQIGHALAAQFKGVGLHYTGLGVAIRVPVSANADSTAHFFKPCDGWANAGILQGH